MAASYPSSAKTFATISNGQASDAGQINSAYDEVTAVEQGLLNGLQHVLKPLTGAIYDLGTNVLKWKDLWLSGDVWVDGALSATNGLSGSLQLNGINGTSLAALATGNNNNVTLGGGAIFFMSGTGSPVLTGMTGGANGRVVIIVNTGGVTVSIPNNDTNSTAANRFSVPATLAVRSAGGVAFVYETSGSRWRTFTAV